MKPVASHVTVGAPALHMLKHLIVPLVQEGVLKPKDVLSRMDYTALEFEAEPKAANPESARTVRAAEIRFGTERLARSLRASVDRFKSLPETKKRALPVGERRPRAGERVNVAAGASELSMHAHVVFVGGFAARSQDRRSRRQKSLA